MVVNVIGGRQHLFQIPIDIFVEVDPDNVASL